MSEDIKIPAERQLEVAPEQVRAVMGLAHDIQRVQIAGDSGNQATLRCLDAFHDNYLGSDKANNTEVMDLAFRGIGFGVIRDQEQFSVAAQELRHQNLTEEQTTTILGIAQNARERRMQEEPEVRIGESVAQSVMAEYSRAQREVSGDPNIQKYKVALLGLGVGGTMKQPQFNLHGRLAEELRGISVTKARQSQ